MRGVFNANKAIAQHGGKYQLSAVFLFTNLDSSFSETNCQTFANAGYAMFHALDFSSTFTEFTGSSIFDPSRDPGTKNYADNVSGALNYCNPIYFWGLGDPENFAWVNFSQAGSSIEGALSGPRFYNGINSFPRSPITELPKGKYKEMVQMTDLIRNNGQTSPAGAARLFTRFFYPYYQLGCTINVVRTHHIFNGNFAAQNANYDMVFDAVESLPWVVPFYNESENVNSNMMLNPAVSATGIHLNGTNGPYWNQLFGRGLRDRKKWPVTIVGTVEARGVSTWTNTSQNTFRVNLTSGSSVVLHDRHGQATSSASSAPASFTVKLGMYFTGSTITFNGEQF